MAACPIFTIRVPVVTVIVDRIDPTVTSMSNLAYTVIDAADSSLNKTSVLVTGETEALVVDAAFTRADGHRILAEVLDSGKRLTTVVVSAGDPDFYFGAEIIADAFPEAVFLAPQDVIEHIEHSYEGKLQAWAHLGPNLPTRLVDLTPLTAVTFAYHGARRHQPVNWDWFMGGN
jgi:glyoxylase-like metal-dependent hydrolase (beta-lactamase superfamily II)